MPVRQYLKPHAEFLQAVELPSLVKAAGGERKEGREDSFDDLRVDSV
jgi:hypothetical protein